MVTMSSESQPFEQESRHQSDLAGAIQILFNVKLFLGRVLMTIITKWMDSNYNFQHLLKMLFQLMAFWIYDNVQSALIDF